MKFFIGSIQFVVPILVEVATGTSQAREDVRSCVLVPWDVSGFEYFQLFNVPPEHGQVFSSHFQGKVYSRYASFVFGLVICCRE
ncbi:hypothetical protein A2U01_0005379 [Trifolium medium]|uniref:Secreted protein n=1 Tax=Trifolium medium TaxID=97028 RepID=A0A392MAM3_9FABA|nr:hypothetical protein [Trifolium medium]